MIRESRHFLDWAPETWELLFRLIEPALVLRVKVACGAAPTSPFAVAPAPERLTLTEKLVVSVPTSVEAFIWKVVASGKVISIDPALVSKSYVPLVPREPLKVIPPAFVLNVEPAVSEAWVAPMEPARLRSDIFPLTPPTVMSPACVMICRSVVGGTVIMKSTLVESKKVDLPERWTATYSVLPLWL